MAILTLNKFQYRVKNYREGNSSILCKIFSILNNHKALSLICLSEFFCRLSSAHKELAFHFLDSRSNEPIFYLPWRSPLESTLVNSNHFYMLEMIIEIKKGKRTRHFTAVLLFLDLHL